MEINSNAYPGQCGCCHVQYRLTRSPLIVHCCHCTSCQRETGSAFAVNALIEADSMEVTRGKTESISMPSNSDFGQAIVRCRVCKAALWSHYGAAKDKVSFVRVGTLLEPKRLPPDIHIFAESRQKWVTLPHDALRVEKYYRRSEVWSAENIKRYQRCLKTRPRSKVIPKNSATYPQALLSGKAYIFEC